ETSMPNHKDPKSVLALAQITQDSYFEQNDPQWIAVPGWNVTSGFGFDSGAIRGYVFENDLEDTLIIVIKGTSLATPIGSGPTAAMDKLNDNMMFSCCCAKTGWSWNKMCDCPQAGNTCSKSCLLRASNFDGSYYNLAQTIYLAVKEWFPKHTDIWMTGHSLGGALASLVALTNNLPAFAYESPERLGLLPAGSRTDMNAFLSSLPIFHFGNTGDPIFLGQCFGPSSSCYWFSYILESHCHVGSECNGVLYLTFRYLWE
ncbi:Alpha/Beta hydrolase protein, partial [Globomyces pollinis-pini]